MITLFAAYFFGLPLKISHINACIYIDNIKSMKLAEKLGFVFKGQMKGEEFQGEKYPHKVLTLDCPAL